MDFRKRRLSISEAKEMDLVVYLASLGIEPSRIKGSSHWYHSPLHQEKTASFVVHRNRNIWYDFGLGRGGSIIDFGQIYHKVSIPEFLQLLTDGNIGASALAPVTNINSRSDAESKIKITGISELSSPSLIAYLDTRDIPKSVADLYCVEIRFASRNKDYFGIGFKNDAGGHEIRNPYFKGSSSPKGITTIANQSEEIAVFEGFFDFLSYATLQKERLVPGSDYLILNSLSFFEKSLPALDQYRQVHLYLDNNAAAQKCVEHALNLSKRFQDQRQLFKGYDDLNDFLLARKKISIKRPRKGLRPGW